MSSPETAPAGIGTGPQQQAEHPAGQRWGPAGRTCGECSWFSDAGCIAARPYGEPALPLAESTGACGLFEVVDSCDPCGACCREAFDAVPADGGGLPETHLLAWDPELTTVRRVEQGRGTRCVCLFGDGRNHPFRCTHYAVRPTACRELERGEPNCLMARRRVDLSEDPFDR